jgi:DNA-binding MarR family transcriptional regulator
MPTLKDELGKRHPFASPEEEAYLNLLRTVSVFEASFAHLFRARGLSEPTYNILRILRGHASAPDANPGGIPCQVIGDQLVSRLPDVTRLVDRLEEAGLVKRSRTTADRRVVLVGITRKGLALLETLDQPLAEAHRAQFRHLTRAELTELNRLLVKARRADPGE